MARPREFDMDLALEAAMQLFWTRGYEATSIEQLLAAMGIARGSLYKAFADKRAVYLAALQRYLDGEITAMERGLRAPGPLLARIEAALAGAITPLDGGERRGCLLCNAAVEMAPSDADVASLAEGGMGRIAAAFTAALAAAPTGAAKAAPGPTEAAAAGEWLAASYMGLRVRAKAGVAPHRLRAALAEALARLG